LTASADSLSVLASSTHEDGVPYEQFARLRRERPLAFVETFDSHLVERAWIVSRYQDVVALDADEERLSAAPAFTLHRRPIFQQPHVLNTDGAEHMRLRKLVSRGFTPRVVRSFEAFIAEIVTKLLDDALPLGGFDFIDQVAADLPVHAICHLMGAPVEDRDFILACANALAGDSDPEFTGSNAADLARAYSDWVEYVENLIDRKMAEPSADVTSELLRAVESSTLSRAELGMFMVLLLGAGSETTRHAISHGVRAFAAHPEQLQAARDDRELLPRAVEEILRWASPVSYIARSARIDFEMHGVQVRAGERVALSYTSANRDEAVFADPDCFEVARSPNPHVAFGVGPHYCLGAALARLELTVMFGQLFDRVQGIEIVGPVERLRSSFMNGIKHLPVRFELVGGGSMTPGAPS
jgi:cholest-4-en-3-one 26-monooxygenase